MLKTKIEMYEELLNIQEDKLLKFKVNVEFYTLLVEENPKDEKLLKQKSEQELAIVRQEKLLDIVRKHLTQAVAEAEKVKEE